MEVFVEFLLKSGNYLLYIYKVHTHAHTYLQLNLKKNTYFFYLVEPDLSCGMQDLLSSLQHVNS